MGAGFGRQDSTVSFQHLVHADWSVNPRKRWQTSAIREGESWHVSAPRRVGPISAFLDDLLSKATTRRVLVGFDFPIGVPLAYGTKTGLADFKEALSAFGTGEWSKFFEVGDDQSEVSLNRPFYPRRSLKGVKRSTLVSALGVSEFRDLLRACERATANQQEACSLFWTLGGNQVGRAAISGWSEVIRPALQAGARLWPFEGALADLSARCGLVLAETYPALAYPLVGAPFLRSESKKRQSDRKKKAVAIRAWADRHSVVFTREADEAVLDGFGPSASGEDPFDAFAGLLKMIEVADGRRPEASALSPDVLIWEGWIMGR